MLHLLSTGLTVETNGSKNVCMRNVSFPNTDVGRREWIKAALRARGHTLGGIAREFGLSRTAAQQALWKPYPRMERAIAEKLGMQPEDIWPGRYERRASRRCRGGRDCMHAHNASTGEGGAQ